MIYVFGIGLPRCCGQTLQAAIAGVTGKTCWHSPGRNLRLRADDAGAVEVYLPLNTLRSKYPGCKFVLNWRERGEWLGSCLSRWEQSQAEGWNHWMWSHYHPDQWPFLYDEYMTTRRISLTLPVHIAGDMLQWDITREPSWEPLCKFLSCPVPDIPFPRRDPVKDRWLARISTPGPFAQLSRSGVRRRFL